MNMNKDMYMYTCHEEKREGERKEGREREGERGKGRCEIIVNV